jgi:hypothetical protein
LLFAVLATFIGIAYAKLVAVPTYTAEQPHLSGPI